VKHKTPTRIFPGGASGPVSDTAFNLEDGTEYTYRFCGTDSSTGGFAVCAQTLTFVSGLSSVQAYGDTKKKGAEFDFDRIYVNVTAAPPGGTPKGRVFFRLNDHRSTTPFPTGVSWEVGSKTDDNINCVNIQGNVAVIGFRQIPAWDPIAPFSNDQFVYIVDGGRADSGQDRFAGTLDFTGVGPAANDCSIPSPLPGDALTHGDAAVSEVDAGSPD
jgi:hypothetical protein